MKLFNLFSKSMINRPLAQCGSLAAMVLRFKPIVTAYYPCSTAAAEKLTKYDDYQKEARLKQIERVFDEAIPKLLHGSYNSFVPFLDRNSFRFEDKVWKFETDSTSKAVFRMAKVRLYLAFKSPHNRFETLGTHICLDDNVVTLIWRLSWPKNAKSAYLISPKGLLANFTSSARRPRSQIGRIEQRLAERESSAPPTSETTPLDSSIAHEVPSPVTNNQMDDHSTQKLTRIENCLDIHVNNLGFVNRLVVRPVTSHDFEMSKLRKMELENEIDQKWRRATREEQRE